MAKAKPQAVGPVRHIIRATRYSLRGLYSALVREQAFRIDLVLCLVLAPIALWVGDTGLERAVLIGCLFILLITELLNSAIETTLDRISEDYHCLTGIAKDIGSAAVFCALANLLIVWLLVIFG